MTFLNVAGKVRLIKTFAQPATGDPDAEEWPVRDCADGGAGR